MQNTTRRHIKVLGESLAQIRQRLNVIPDENGLVIFPAQVIEEVKFFLEQEGLRVAMIRQYEDEWAEVTEEKPF